MKIERIQIVTQINKNDIQIRSVRIYVFYSLYITKHVFYL